MRAARVRPPQKKKRCERKGGPREHLQRSKKNKREARLYSEGENCVREGVRVCKKAHSPSSPLTVFRPLTHHTPSPFFCSPPAQRACLFSAHPSLVRGFHTIPRAPPHPIPLRERPRPSHCPSLVPQPTPISHLGAAGEERMQPAVRGGGGYPPGPMGRSPERPH